MMKIIRKIVNPIFMALIIVASVYIYSLSHDSPKSGWFENKEGEAEKEIIQRNIKQNVPNTAVVAGQQYWQGQEQKNQQYQFQNPDYFQQTATLNQNIAQQPVKTPDKILQEGHWIGLEVIPLIPSLARANNIPTNISGVLIDEVTLLAAEAGLLAGDVIIAINGHTIQDLNSFKLATRQVANSKEAIVSIYRNGGYRDIMAYGPEALGVAQMEAAPMILATDRSPHGYYGSCDRCHAISRTAVNTGQLGKDQGDVLTKVAPPIQMGMPPPHGDIGRCTNCHKII